MKKWAEIRNKMISKKESDQIKEELETELNCPYCEDGTCEYCRAILMNSKIHTQLKELKAQLEHVKKYAAIFEKNSERVSEVNEENHKLKLEIERLRKGGSNG